MKQSLKQALIEVIISCKNNPYSLDELKPLRLFIIQQIHDDLMLTKGIPNKLTESELGNWREQQFD